MGPGNVTPIFAQKLAGRLAITNETVNGFNAIAAADPSGAIMKDGRTGKQLVYPLGRADRRERRSEPGAGDAGAARTAAGGSGQPPAARAAPRAAGRSAARQRRVPAVVPAAEMPESSGPVEVRRRHGARDGGSEGYGRRCRALVRAIQPDVQGLRRGSGRRAAARPDRFTNIDFKATANCETGQLVAIDELTYTYVGTWPNGPGAGRPKFKGPHTTTATTTFEQQGAVSSGERGVLDLRGRESTEQRRVARDPVGDPLRHESAAPVACAHSRPAHCANRLRISATIRCVSAPPSPP